MIRFVLKRQIRDLILFNPAFKNVLSYQSITFSLVLIRLNEIKPT